MRKEDFAFPLPPNSGPRLGIGQAVKRDAVMVKVITEDGIVGWGESHHGRAHRWRRLGDGIAAQIDARQCQCSSHIKHSPKSFSAWHDHAR